MNKCNLFCISVTLFSLPLFGQDSLLDRITVDYDNNKYINYVYSNDIIYILEDEDRTYGVLFIKGFLSGKVIMDYCPCINTPQYAIDMHPDFYRRKIINIGNIKATEFGNGILKLFMYIECYDETDNTLEVELKFNGSPNTKNIKKFLKRATLEYVKYLGKDA